MKRSSGYDIMSSVVLGGVSFMTSCFGRSYSYLLGEGFWLYVMYWEEFFSFILLLNRLGFSNLGHIRMLMCGGRGFSPLSCHVVGGVSVLHGIKYLEGFQSIMMSCSGRGFNPL